MTKQLLYFAEYILPITSNLYVLASNFSHPYLYQLYPPFALHQLSSSSYPTIVCPLSQILCGHRPLKGDYFNSSNLTHLQSVLHIAQEIEGLVALQQTFTLVPSLGSTPVRLSVYTITPCVYFCNIFFWLSWFGKIAMIRLHLVLYVCRWVCKWILWEKEEGDGWGCTVGRGQLYTADGLVSYGSSYYMKATYTCGCLHAMDNLWVYLFVRCSSSQKH